MIHRLFNPKNDVAFKRLFGTEKNQDILITLLNLVLGSQLTKPIEQVRFLNPIQPPEVHAKKESVVDVLCRDEDHVQYIIEMQVAHGDDFLARAQYYASKAFVSQMVQGGRYAHLKEVIFLAFVDFELFPDKDHYKSEHILLDRKDHKNDLDKFSFTFVELPKFDRQRPKDLSRLTREEQFFYFLHHAEHLPPEELKLLMQQDPIIERATLELSAFNWSDEEQRSYEAEYKRVQDNLSVLYQAKKESRAEGRAEGIAEGRAEGKAEGIAEGRAEGIAEGRAEGIEEAIQRLMKNKGLSRAAAEQLLS